MQGFVQRCRHFGSSLVLAIACLIPIIPATAFAGGTLRVLSSNPRYFTDDSGRAIYLAGSHTWNNLRDRSDLPVFDFPQYLDFLQSHHHNFIRLWVSNYNNEYLPPYTYLRTGPGNALDGKPKFDLNSFDQSHFDRMRARIIAARDRGFFVAIMLFQDHALLPEDWNREAFNAANNKNGINGDTNGDGSGLEAYSLGIPALVAVHEAYVRKVVDVVNDLDNVIYEISNESGAQSTAWQYHLIQYIKNYEAGKPKQHPVGMTFQYPDGNDQTLFNSNAEWISPSDAAGYTSNPPVNNASKVVLVDTDHLCGTCSDPQWPWKNFMRGHNFLLMDPYYSSPSFESTRKAMGQTVDYSNRMDLAHATPQPNLSSTGYLLANVGREYLVYQPSSGAFTVNVLAGAYNFEWFDTSSGTVKETGSFTASAGNRTFTPSFSGPAVLYLTVSGGGSASPSVPSPPSNVRLVSSPTVTQQVTFKLFGSNNLDAVTLPAADVTIATAGYIDWVRSGTSAGPLVTTTPSLGGDGDGLTASAVTIRGPGVFHVDVDTVPFSSASAKIAGVTKPFVLNNDTYVATFTSTNQQPGSLTLTWDAPTQSTAGGTPAVTGYKVYWGTAQGTYPSSAAVSGTSYSVGTLAAGTWHFVVTAVSTAGESVYSNVASTTVEGSPLPEPPPPPPPADPCVATPLALPTNLAWPSSRSGARTFGWNSPANIVAIDYRWPNGGSQSATWTDDRGCKATVTR